MSFRQKTIRYIFSLIMLASVMPTLAQTLFNVFSKSHIDNKTHHNYLCMQYDQDSEGYIQITKVREDLYDGNVDAAMYANAADVGDKSKALKTFTNVPDSNAVFTVYRDDINPTKAPKTVSKSYFVQVCKTGSTTECETTEMIFDTYHTEDVPEINIDPYCYGNTPASLTATVIKYNNSNKYSWKDDTGRNLSAIDFLSISALAPGDHKYKLQNRNGECYSPGVEIVLSVLSNDAPHLSQSYVTYTSADIVDGSFSKTVAQMVDGQIVDNNQYDCTLTWYDKNGNIINNFESYIPPIPEKYGTTIDEFKVSKDCGCRTPLKYSSFYIMTYVVPKPSVEDLEFCVNDSHAADGFDAIIGLSGEATESASDFLLQFSKNSDMSDAISLSAGATHFNYTFDVSEAGTHTYYVRQQKVDNGQYSEIVPFKVVVKQPSKPVLSDQKVCANSASSVLLSSISSETNLMWKDGNDTPITGSVAIEKRGDITVSAQKSETINGSQCLSDIATATIHVDSLGVSISGSNNVLMPGQTGTAELDLKGSGSQTISWSSDAANSIVGDVNKSDISFQMGTSDLTLNAVVTDGVCSQSANWTVQVDLFQCSPPTADDIKLCLNDPRAADGFDANITLDGNSDSKSNYKLSVSKNADMSDATVLDPGETHFNYTFDASTTGDKKVYIQQTEVSRNLSSAIIPVKVNVSQPTSPSANSATICLNDEREVRLSDLSTESNLQWLDENKSEIATTAQFNKRGTHSIYVKRYELVNGQECWSDLTTVNITADSIGTMVTGDDHLCPNSEGEVTLTSVIPTTIQVQWESDRPFTIANTSSPTVSVKMGENDLNLNYTVTSGVCKSHGTWEITVGTGKVEGRIQFTEGDKVRATEDLTNAEFSSCGGIISVVCDLAHTSSEFTVRKGNKDLGTYSFADDYAKFNVEGAGSYTVVYENDCKTSFSFNVTEMKIKPTVTTTKWSSCYGGYISAEISNVDGCEVVWKKDGTEVAKDTKTLKINNVTAENIGDYTYDLVCDGCPADGIVSYSKPDIYSPLTVSVTQSADTICQKDEVEVEISISPSSEKVSYKWASDDDMRTANSGASATLSPFYSKEYSVVIGNGDCAPQTKTVSVYVQPQMNGNIEAGSIMCEGDSTEIDASSLQAERYEWEHTDLDTSIITVVPNGVSNKYVVTAYRGKCVLEKEFTLMVGATPKLASVDSIGLDDVEIIMETAGEYQFVVDGKDNVADVADNVKKHVGFGDHTLSIIDEAGCKTDTSFTVSTPPFEIQNYINPNSNGKDAAFRIPDAVIVYESATMNIYDRWGTKLVTLTSSDSEGWDGTYNGNPMPSTDYWYELNVDVIDKVYVGHFTLIRE